MGFNINDIGKQVVNPVIGLFINDKTIPLGSKGELNSIEHETERVFVRWLVDGKAITTNFTFSQFEQLEQSGVLLEVSEYEEPPTPKFEVGDIVEGSALVGVVKSRKFDAVSNSWVYTTFQLDGIFSGDYILRYDVSEEKYIEKVLEEVTVELDYNNNRKYALTLKEIVD